MSFVLVTVGTDCHPIDRLIDWTDRWWNARLASGGPSSLRCLVQYGNSRPPVVAEGRPFLGHQGLIALMREAAAVICHGGPATITESRRAGRRPVVVPRSPLLGEHVDDHQERFCARLAARELISVASSEREFRSYVDRALVHPAEFTVSLGGDTATEAIGTFAQLVDELLLRRKSPSR